MSGLTWGDDEKKMWKCEREAARQVKIRECGVWQDEWGGTRRYLRAQLLHRNTHRVQRPECPGTLPQLFQPQDHTFPEPLWNKRQTREAGGSRGQRSSQKDPWLWERGGARAITDRSVCVCGRDPSHLLFNPPLIFFFSLSLSLSLDITNYAR